MHKHGLFRDKLRDYFYDVNDIVLALFIIGITLPLFILAVFLVKADSRGPVIYKQPRYGKNKKVFILYKFRTMGINAEKWGPVWGSESDPRSGKLGKFLRISHIDELPQLFNVLKGQMSLVGPRPERPYFADEFYTVIPGYEERYKVKPGLTGWSQVNGLRGESPVDERTLYDVFYIRNRTYFFYLKILLFTLRAKSIKPEHKHAKVKPLSSTYFFPDRGIPPDKYALYCSCQKTVVKY